MTVAEAFRLDGRTALVTGGGRGLGAAAARALAEAGASVVVAGRDVERLRSVCEQIGASGGVARFVTMDVSDAASVDAAFEHATAEGPIDVLVNNAGVATDARAVDTSDEEWRRVLGTNLDGSFFCARAFARRLDDRAAGVIVNLASIASSVGVAGQVAYAASKGGITAMTRALALELAPQGVRVNALAPGYFMTDMPADALADDGFRERLIRRIPLRRIPDPAEVGPPVVFLASPASGFMTGATLFFDGGYTAR